MFFIKASPCETLCAQLRPFSQILTQLFAGVLEDICFGKSLKIKSCSSALKNTFANSGKTITLGKNCKAHLLPVHSLTDYFLVSYCLLL